MVTENEIVLPLPPHAYLMFSWMWVLAGGCGLWLWHAYHDPFHALPATNGGGVDYVSCAVPLWLPSVVLILFVGLHGMWADPWFRRALAIIPKGLRQIRVQVGNRVIGESHFERTSIFVTEEDDDDTGYLCVRTPFWNGTRWAWHWIECYEAEGELKKWAGWPTLPGEEGHG
jgi:hypothetical protein